MSLSISKIERRMDSLRQLNYFV